MQSEDARLINQILEGREGAFRILVDKYKRYTYTLALRVVKRGDLAEEISQDVFIKVHKNLRKFKGESSLKTWLYTITYRTSLNALKKEKRYSSEDIELARGAASDVKRIDQSLEEGELKGALEKLISQLTKNEALVLTLFYFDEMSLKEVQEITKLEMNNIKIILFRARKKLRSLIANQNNNTFESWTK